MKIITLTFFLFVSHLSAFEDCFINRDILLAHIYDNINDINSDLVNRRFSNDFQAGYLVGQLKAYRDIELEMFDSAYNFPKN